jgi:meiotic recombination protein SPO11
MSVQASIEGIVGELLDTKNVRDLEFIDRKTQNSQYDEAKKIIIAKNSSKKRRISFKQNPIEYCRYMKLMSMIYQLKHNERHISKRDVYYSDVNLFKKQKKTDAILENLAAMFGVHRNDLNILAAVKGLAIGNLTFRTKDGNEVDCLRCTNAGPISIPADVEDALDFKTDAQYVLLIEKDSIFEKLINAQFHIRYNCLLVTGKGYPDLATRMLIRKLSDMRIPILALMDADPHGIEILLTYTIGSNAMNYTNEKYACEDIQWLGLLPSDLFQFNLHPKALMQASPEELKKCRQLMAQYKSFFETAKPSWGRELQVMIERGTKAELQALTAESFTYFAASYLPYKIENGLFI